MRIGFDPIKRADTLAHRGLDMAQCAHVFDGVSLTFSDLRQDYGEDRFITVGYYEGRMVVLVWTNRGDERRIISLRKANEREIKLYESALD